MTAVRNAAPASAGRSSLRAGIDPIDNVHLMENHDEAWHLWHRAGVAERVLVHIDAHHDMWWIDDNRHVTIANFLCPALRENILRKVFWIVPDGAFKNSTARRAVVQQVKSIVRGYKGDGRLIEVTPTSITASVLGKKLTVCAIASLDVGSEAVLLDIDVDYLIIPRVAHNRPDEHAELPWCWPAELIEKIKGTGLRADRVTIAYSVEGCYTPLAWKYLGDELAARIRHPGDQSAVASFGLLRAATNSLERGDLQDAECKYFQALTGLPQSAAPHYHLAMLCAKRDRADEAQRHCRKARELDPTYATGFNNRGLHYLWQKRYLEAQVEFQLALVLNPADGYACVGMARLAALRKQWSDAIDWSRKALDCSDQILDAHRGLGEAYARLGDLDNAANHYERSLQLALHGHKPLSWHILTATRPDQLLDEDHCASYVELGRVYIRRGEIQRAIASYQIALASNMVGVRLRLQLASLFLREFRWREARCQLALAGRQVPTSARRHVRHGWRRLVNDLSGRP